MRISVYESASLQGVILALKSADREIGAQIRKQTRAMVEPEWKTAVAQRCTWSQEARVLGDTARASVSNQNVTLKAGALSKRLSGGAKAYEIAALTEFGADPNWKHQATSTRGKTFSRRLGPRFKARNRKGYVVYPAAAEIIPRIASLWVQTVVRTLNETIEGGAR